MGKWMVFIVMLLFLSQCIFIEDLKFEKPLRNYKIPDDALIVITDSTLQLRGHSVQLLDSIATFIEALGPYDRTNISIIENPINTVPTGFIWDSLGITVETVRGDTYPQFKDHVKWIDLHLSGMDSDVARQGLFEHAREFEEIYKDSIDLIDSKLKRRKRLIASGDLTKNQVIQSGKEHWKVYKKDRNWRRYFYPYRNLPGSIYMNGAPIYTDDVISMINRRRDSVGADLFGYIDRSSGPFVRERDLDNGETEKMFTAFYYAASPLKRSRKLPYNYELKVAGSRIHYIRVYLIDMETLESL